ncbi:oligoendopeptidase F [Salinicoccus hispanicus]|uniref:Oligopeptidase F n=1 Tax=Salinicoccus hispanicus TaxID=157225 RepID=A0A6N8U092_9STAP|nr:oligoendopeptidase F [Salinicoccus hispanicus]MXQ50346.1 oligoendopeptidase F [Salinicoccus hispanicus]
MEQLKSRNEVEEKYTWNLSDLFASDEAFEKAVQNIRPEIKSFSEKFSGGLSDAKTAIEALESYRNLTESLVPIGAYANLRMASDQGDASAQKLSGLASNISTYFGSETSFLTSELLQKDTSFLEEVKSQASEFTNFVDELLKNKPYQLDANVEKALASYSTVFEGPYSLYQKTKLLDIDFGTFKADGQEIPLSYLAFEGELESHENTEIRHSAFRAFSDKLAEYQHTTAATYDLQLKQEKTTSDLRGFDSVFDYLLHRQDVDQSLYNRQIDMIMSDLSPHMRRYAKLLKRVHNLDEMKYEDLKISLDPSSEPEISIEESRKYINDALAIMGDDYVNMVNRAYDERWIDFVKNKGKSTGAFCSSPYGSHPFILISWTSLMTEVFVLAHELGHAGHFYNANRSQNVFDARSSMYFVEAPSTMNEMLMANHLLENSDDPKFKRWVISSIISRTYYHNCVTHLLEAAYQREVYKKVDQNESVSAPVLNQLKREVIEEFWGDDVSITEGAELTWMRQPHYYMGLYPYTYSAGLTIATAMSKRVLNEGQTAVDDWLKVLNAGGTEDPVELARMGGVDITTEQPLRDTIDYIGELVDQLEALTEEIEG